MGFSWSETGAFLAHVRGLVEVRPITLEVHASGLALAERFRVSVYDAMIVAAALDAGCGVLWSEDMRDGLLIDGALTITNPFAAKP